MSTSIEALRHAIRWRGPRVTRGRRRPCHPHDLGLLRGVELAANDAFAAEAPPTVRQPGAPTETSAISPRPPAVLDALCASLEVLAAERVPCELDVLIDPGASARLYGDPDLAARLLSPFASAMPAREGLVPIGTVQVAGRRIRIYERAA